MGPGRAHAENELTANLEGSASAVQSGTPEAHAKRVPSRGEEPRQI